MIPRNPPGLPPSVSTGIRSSCHHTQCLIWVLGINLDPHASSASIYKHRSLSNIKQVILILGCKNWGLLSPITSIIYQQRMAQPKTYGTISMVVCLVCVCAWACVRACTCVYVAQYRASTRVLHMPGKNSTSGAHCQPVDDFKQYLETLQSIHLTVANIFSPLQIC